MWGFDDIDSADVLALSMLASGTRSVASVDAVPMLLWCPACGERHVDVGEFASGRAESPSASSSARVGCTGASS